MKSFIEYEKDSNHTLITITTDTIDLMKSPKLSKEILTLLKDLNYPDLIIDLVNVEYINSAGLGCLVGINNELKEHNKKLFYVCNNEKVLKIINITGVSKILTIYSTTNEAIDNL